MHRVSCVGIPVSDIVFIVSALQCRVCCSCLDTLVSFIVYLATSLSRVGYRIPGTPVSDIVFLVSCVCAHHATIIA